MKHSKLRLAKAFIFYLVINFAFVYCTKQSPSVEPPTGSRPTVVNQPEVPPSGPLPLFVCDSNRSIVNAKMTVEGQLSQGRIGLVAAAAGSKIFFAGGMVPGAYTARVDIYDTAKHSWSMSELTVKERQGMAVATIGNKIFFAGGQDADWIDVTSRVDIYDLESDTWSTAELSEPRAYLATAVLGSKIYFAGGANWGSLPPGSHRKYFVGSKAIDIYDYHSGKWTTAQLSEGRYELSATVAGDKIYFAGGLNSIFSISRTIDILDASANEWSTSLLEIPRAGHAAVASGNKIFWVGGATSSYQSGYTLSNRAEIKDLSSGTSYFECISPKSHNQVATTKDHLIFFTGNAGINHQFEIYQIATGKWLTALLDQPINSAAIVGVNNTVYVAGGRGQNAWGPYSNSVWKLEF